MAKKRKTGLAMGAAAACIAVLCAEGASNEITKEENAVLPTAATSTVAIIITAPPTTTAPATTTGMTTVLESQ